MQRDASGPDLVDRRIGALSAFSLLPLGKDGAFIVGVSHRRGEEWPSHIHPEHSRRLRQSGIPARFSPPVRRNTVLSAGAIAPACIPEGAAKIGRLISCSRTTAIQTRQSGGDLSKQFEASYPYRSACAYGIVAITWLE